MLCLRVIRMCPSMLIRHDLDVGAGDDACLQIAAQRGLLQCCCHGNFYTTELCECFRVVSSVKFPTFTLSALVLFVFHRVFTPSFHTYQNEMLMLFGLVSSMSSSAASTE